MGGGGVAGWKGKKKRNRRKKREREREREGFGSNWAACVLLSPWGLRACGYGGGVGDYWALERAHVSWPS
jgi:hypothetical protein